MDKIKKWFFNEEDEEFEYNGNYSNSNDDSYNGNKNSKKARQFSDVVVVLVDEVEKMSIVGDAMKQGKIVITKIDNEILVRTLDFISGVEYALGYKEQKMTKYDYIFIPDNVSIDKEYTGKFKEANNLE